jgi:hypothetical protein
MRLSSLTLVLAFALSPSIYADEPVRLREDYAPGAQYHVSCRVELTGNLTLPPEKSGAAPKTLPVSGTSVIEYDERILARAADGQVSKTFRIYRQVDFRRKLGNQPQESTLRPSVRRLVLLRLQNAEVPFSPDGPLTWGEIDLIRTDVFTPALAGLLPGQPSRPGDRWTATEAAVQELTDLERLEEGRIECRFEQVTLVDRRRYARIALTGTVRGVNEDGPSRQTLDGYLLFDLESNHLSYLTVRGVKALLDEGGRTAGTVEGRFVLTRQAYQRAADLGDEALRGVVLEPNADNTLLLYDNPQLGVRFLHPRRWHVGGVRGRQLGLDEKGGSGVLLTVDVPGQATTGAQFLAETRAWLQQQKAQIYRIDDVRRLQGSPREVEHFTIDAEVGGQRALLEYYVLRQAGGSATLAARLLPKDAAALQREVEQLARGLQLDRPRP